MTNWRIPGQSGPPSGNPVFTEVKDSAINGNVLVDGEELKVYDDAEIKGDISFLSQQTDASSQDISAINTKLMEKADLLTVNGNFNAVNEQLAQTMSLQTVVGKRNEGETTDVGRITRALTKAFNEGIKTVVFPHKTYDVTQTIVVPVGVDIDGLGATINVPKDHTFEVFTITSGNQQSIKNLNIVETGHSYTQRSTGRGILVQGNSEHILIENVHVEGCQSGIGILPSDGQTCKNIVLRNCRADYSAQYGIVVSNTNIVELDNCYAYYNWLDGFKLRKTTNGVSVYGGESSFNGESAVSSAGNGNGLDAYAGGENFIIFGLVADSNRGAGIYTKTGDLNVGGLEGNVRDNQIIGVQCRNNTGSGLDINRVSGDTYTYPLATHFSIIGGVFESNGVKGIYVRGRNVTITSPICKNNGEEGIYTTSSSFDITINSPIITANGRVVANISGILLNGKRQRINGGTINGADGDAIYTDDHTGLTVYHYAGIRVGASSDDNIIRDVVVLNHTFSHGVRIDTGGHAIVHYGKLNKYATYGSEGSTVVYNGIPYLKITDSSDVTAAGWVKMNKVASATSDSTATDVETLKTNFNTLLSRLRSAGLMA